MFKQFNTSSFIYLLLVDTKQVPPKHVPLGTFCSVVSLRTDGVYSTYGAHTCTVVVLFFGRLEANLRGSLSLRRCFSGMDRHRLRARAATVPAPICRACACRRVMVSWMDLVLASGRICCLREHCAPVTASRSVAVEPSCLGQTALAAAVRRLGPSPRKWICVRGF